MRCVVQEEGDTPAIPRGSEGVLQRGAGADDRWDPEGVRGRRVVGEPPFLPRKPVGVYGQRRPGREVPQEVRGAQRDHGDSCSQGRDCYPLKAQGCFQRRQEKIIYSTRTGLSPIGRY